MISAVTVTFNSKEFIRGCLNSVAQNAGAMDIEHIVVDNGSKDGTPDILKSEFPQVVLIQNSVNRGFTAANNQGQRVARGDYVVFLNPDTIVPEGTFQTMMETMERHCDMGVLAPRLVDKHGCLSFDMGHRAPTAWTLINSFLLLNRLSHDLFPGVLRTKDVAGLEDCDWACGACLMVRREVADAFAWREFGAGDDFDYCIQIREAGWRVVVSGDVQVTHFAGRSWKLAKPTTLVGTASNFARYLHERRGPLHTVVGIAGMRLGLRLRGAVHHLLYRLTRDPERLDKANKTRQFLAHDDYSVFRKVKRPTPTSYPG
jgi:N-acetylglucosaminyl-diphospho-decaprenol L-rhamnosyltransferase